jgi:hypothetical protein
LGCFYNKKTVVGKKSPNGRQFAQSGRPDWFHTYFFSTADRRKWVSEKEVFLRAILIA